MQETFKKTWETYASAWKAESLSEKKALFKQVLDTQCTYRDPQMEAQGFDELAGYMLEFHKQVPGGHFVTTYFLAHHNRSVAKWNMVGGSGEVLGEGVSYGEYNAAGKLTTMTGFFDTPEA